MTRKHSRARSLRARIARSKAPLCEALEDRRLLSTIIWTNRGAGSDNFDAVFGAGAPADAARAVMDAALDAWNQVVVNFNHDDGIGPPDLEETISMNPGSTGCGASTSTTIASDGRPTAGSQTFGICDTDGNGTPDWFIDPTPHDNSEFLGNINNAFTGSAQAGSPAFNRGDLFSVALAELTHNMGICNAGCGSSLYNTGSFTVDTGTADDAEGGGTGNFWLFQGPSVDSLMTNNNGGAGGSAATFPLHTAGPRANNAPIVFGGKTVFGVDDNGNASYAFGQRTLVSNKTALILKDAFNYEIVMPETFGTFYAVVNETTGLLTVRGGADNTVVNGVNQGVSADNITITRSGDSIVVSVDVGVDVPGTGSGRAANDAQDAFVSVFPAGKVTSISVVAGDGNDNVTLGSDLGIPATVDGGSGNDTLIGGDVTLIGNAGDDYLYGSNGNDSLDGGSGNDTIYGLDGNDTIVGGADNDQIYAGKGNNTVTDGGGNDIVDLSENAIGVTYNTGGGNDVVVGTAFADLITGSSGNDILQGRGGNDTLVGGAGGDQLIGGTGSDHLVWNNGDGSDLMEGEEGTDVVEVNGSGASGDSFTVSANGARVSFQRTNLVPFTLDIAGAEQLSIASGGGADSVTINDVTATDLDAITIDGGSDADSFIVNGRSIADNLLASGSGNVSVGGLAYDISILSASTADTLTIKGNDGNDIIKAEAGIESSIQIVLDGGNGNDFLSADATLLGGAGSDTLIGGAGDDSLDGGAGDDRLDGAGGNNTLNGGIGTDTILVSGTEGNDDITTTHTAGAFNVVGGASAGNNTISGMERVRVEAGSGDDKITLKLLSAGGLAYTVFGGDPIGAVGDLLTVVSDRAVAYTQGPENDSGSLVAATDVSTTVSFDEIEAISISGGPAVINGTNGFDAITIIARDSSTHPGTDGVRDFTVTVNDNPEFLFIDIASLTINALGGSDEIALSTPAPNNADWDVDVTINGGLPADGDVVIVNTPGDAAETSTFTPTAFDKGTLSIAEANPANASNITLTGVEQLVYDGQADGDWLTINGNASNNVIVHEPGAANDEGSLRVDSNLALNYQNMGSSARLQAAGGAGVDRLDYHGTIFNDKFTIDTSFVGGRVGLSSRLGLLTSDIEICDINAQLGDDTAWVTPSVASSPFSTINIYGGEQASGKGDKLNLNSSAGNDDVIISGNTVSAGGVTVNTNGVEEVVFNFLGGVDHVTYNGIAGTSENINLISSTVAGAGQLSIPSVALYTFQGLESANINGNNGALGDVDTFTVTGTNSPDRFEIHLDAAGTLADPVLRLQTLDGSNTLLTLNNYTNVQTLRVSSLDGGDLFNVYTSPANARDLFVDGGIAAGKKKSTDKLNVFYTPSRPRIIQSVATQDHDAGLVDLLYDNGARFIIQYLNVENVVIAKL